VHFELDFGSAEIMVSLLREDRAASHIAFERDPLDVERLPDGLGPCLIYQPS
jgi:hypothetical protein